MALSPSRGQAPEGLTLVTIDAEQETINLRRRSLPTPPRQPFMNLVSGVWRCGRRRHHRRSCQADEIGQVLRARFRGGFAAAKTGESFEFRKLFIGDGGEGLFDGEVFKTPLSGVIPNVLRRRSALVRQRSAGKLTPVFGGVSNGPGFGDFLGAIDWCRFGCGLHRLSSIFRQQLEKV